MRIKFSLASLFALSILFISGFTGQNDHDELASHIDLTVSPGEDFFLYANGKWFKENPIPANLQQNGLWQVIQDTLDAQIRNICVSSAASTGEVKGSIKQKIGDFYYSGMDSVSLNTAGISGLKKDLDMIDKSNDLNELIKAVGYVHMVSSSPLFSYYLGQDDKISSKIAVFVGQGGLSLPDRNYYFDKDSRAKETRNEFVKHLEKIFIIMGKRKADAKTAAEEVMELETRLAKISRKSEDLRDPHENYNKYSIKQFSALAPNIDWSAFFSSTGLNGVDSIICGQPEYLKGLNELLEEYSLDQWKSYLKYHLIRGLAKYMDDKTYMVNFDFYSKVLLGIEEPKPRWIRVVEQTNGLLGELVGQVYVSEYLPKGTKEKLQEIGNNIKSVYAERIKSLDWMGEATKTKALIKLEGIVMKVGYPDKWKDVSNLDISRSSYLQNAISATRWDMEQMILKYGKPVDRTEWAMQPQEYNAYYEESNNEIVIPGCNIIVPGYEKVLADDAILYSIIGGSTFGHEITHGFDDQGSKYDEFGNLNNWWTSEDSARFYEKTKMIVKQYDEYIAVDDLHVNGEMTQGENIADLGGIMMGFEAFKKTDQYKSNISIAGLNPTQRYFLGFAYAWMINNRPESIADLVRSDEHSPPKFRVIGAVTNMPEFFEAFGIKPGDKMWRDESVRVKIW